VKRFIFDGAASPVLGWTSQRLLEGGDVAVDNIHPVSKAGLLLWAGRWQEAEAELAGLAQAEEYWQTHYLRGLPLLLHGNADCLACFRRCAEVYRTAPFTPFPALPSVPSFARQLAVFLFGSPQEQEALRREADIASGKDYLLSQRWNVARGLHALRALDWLRQAQDAKARFLLCRLRGAEPHFLAAMVCFGAHQRLGILREGWSGAIGTLEGWHAMLAGLPAAQGIAGGILAKALPPEQGAAFAPDPVCEGMLDFSLLVAEDSFWQVQLGALEQAARNEEESREDQTEKKRLFWAVDKDMRLVEAREQTRTARGWGTLRPAALKRLRDRQDDYGWLSPGDRRVLACAESRDQWGGSPLILSLERCCEVLEGLGNVCRMTDSGLEPVHVRRGALKLKLTCQGEGCRLAIDGFDLSAANLEEGDKVFLLKNGIIYYFKLSLRERRIAGIVGAGIDFPKSAIQRVLDISLQDAGVPLQAEIDAEEIDADATPVLQLEQDEGGGFSALVGVRPFGLPDTPFYPVGEGAPLPLAAVPRPAPAKVPAAPAESGESGNAGAGSAEAPAAPAEAGESGSVVAPPAAETVPMRARRDFDAEKAALAVLVATCPCLASGLDGHTWHSQGPEEVLELLEELKACAQSSRVEWPRGRAVRLAGMLKPANVKLSVSRGPGRDWFSLSGEASIDEGRVVTVEALLQSLEGSRFVSLGDGEYLALTDELRRKLAGMKAMMAGQAKGGELQFSGLAAPAVEQMAQGMDI
jgi:hypothetical protein